MMENIAAKKAVRKASDFTRSCSYHQAVQGNPLICLQGTSLLRHEQTLRVHAQESLQSSCPPRRCCPGSRRSTSSPRSILGNCPIHLGSCNPWYSTTPHHM